MKILSSRTFWGILLILGGVLFLLQNLGVFQGGDLFWGICLGIAGLLFLGFYIGDRQQWWALIPGIVLIAVGILVLLSSFVPGFNDTLGGTIILGGIGLSFLFVYLVNRANWWSLIPAGVLLTLAVIAGLEGVVSDGTTGGIFFLGLGLTFAIVGIVPTPSGKMKWAWITAVILVFVGLLVFTAAENLLVYLLPLALVLAGGVLIWRAFRSK